MGNTIIIYEPKSRPEVLNKILEAYRQAKQERPDLFNLSPRQKASVTRRNLLAFKALVDANMSFVEMAPEDGGQSYDSSVINEIRELFGFDPRIMNPSLVSLEGTMQLLEEKQRQFVMVREDREGFNKGRIKHGQEVHYKRKLSAPALIQTGTIVMGKQAA